VHDVSPTRPGLDAAYRQGTNILRGKETKSIDQGLSEYPVNLYRSRTYILKTRLASLSLITAVLLLGGCYSHHYHDDDDGWRDGDRGHRHHHRHDRDDDDDRQYRDRYQR
jgi:hypothetical protein